MSVWRRIAVGEFIVESTQDSVVAAGTTQATAFQLANVELNRVTGATAGSATGVMLPPAFPGLSLVVVNHSGISIQVYGQPGDTVDDAASANGVPQMKNSWVFYTCFTAGAWYTEGLASGFAAYYSGAFATISSVDGLTATTTGSAATGTPITANQARFTTIAANLNAATLPPAKAGMQIVVQNSHASSTLTVWAASAALGGVSGGDLINSAATSIIVASGGTTPTVFYAFADGQWYTK